MHEDTSHFPLREFQHRPPRTIDIEFGNKSQDSILQELRGTALYPPGHSVEILERTRDELKGGGVGHSEVHRRLI